ncbi:WD40 repeat domain-containing protein [Nitrosophilus kaiyonis]|uniref:WD40 repeat domain-containing protein n=1 Tax=Nitrosophilus kaiyonis TaxID=2930200 RepID=UPI0024922188|nr:WD40 repeat domain-containing protein [Nitrosophilus kaiyonis]
MKKIIILLLSIFAFAFAVDIKPFKKIDIGAAVLDIAIENSKIYVATDASKVLILDKDLNRLKEIKVRKVKDFMGELNNADIYSIDVLDNTVLYLAQAEEGYSELFIYKDGKKEKVLDKSAMMYAKAAKFVDKTKAILVLMSDEVVLYDIKNKKVLKRKRAGEYFYSVSSIERDRKYFAIGDEGGEVIVVDTKTLENVKVFKDINKDKILSIFINKDLVAAGSRADKTFALYNIKSGNYKTIKNPKFFIYAVGLSPDNRLAIYGDNEKFILKGIDTSSYDLKYRFIGHTHIVNVIRFLDKNLMITGSETGEIILWRLK